MTILLYFAAVACAACALWTMEENRKWKKLAAKMQAAAEDEKKKRETAETEARSLHELVAVAKAESRQMEYFKSELRLKCRALDEREKELAGERDKCAELRRLLAETREMLDEERRARENDEREIRNIMNYDGTADSQEALNEE